MSKSSIKGLDKLQRELKKLEKKAEQLGGTRQVPIEELLTPEFMQRFTRFGSVDDMFDQSGFPVETEQDIEALVHTAEWDAFVATNTQFPTWEDIIGQAGQEYISRLWESE